MRLVVDLQSAQSGSRHGGIGRYSTDLLKGMIRTAPNHEVVVVCSDLFPLQVNEIRSTLRNCVNPMNIQTFSVPPGVAHIHGNMALIGAAETLREQFIRSLHPDAIHTTSVIEGLLEDIVTSVHKSEGGCAEVATLYDLIPHIQRDAYLQNPRARTHYYRKMHEIRRADGLLAISEYSAQEFIHSFGRGNRIIADIKSGIEPQFRVISNPRLRSNDIDLFNLIDQEFILYTASFDYRKNQKGLIKAYSMLPSDIRLKYKLVIAGGGEPSVYDALLSYSAACGVEDGRILFVGRVSDEELVLLYNMCALFVFPSLWEGLGMPILEALACGAPAIASNTTSMPEVLGNPLGLFDPTDEAAMANKMHLALTDVEFRRNLTGHVNQHLAEFTWDRAAQKAWDVIEQVVARKSHEQHRPGGNFIEALRRDSQLDELLDLDIATLARHASINECVLDQGRVDFERKIGWVTTWGIRCGIANYAAQLLESSKENVIVFSAHADEIEFGSKFHFIPTWNQGKSDDLMFLAQQIELNNITDVMIQFNYGFFDFDSLNGFVQRMIRGNRRVFFTLHSTVDQTEVDNFRLEYLLPALSVASGLFVHSPFDVKRLAQIGIVSNVTLISIGAHITRDTAPAPGSNTRKVATYGFALPGKGLDILIEIAKILRDRGEPIKLAMHNADYNDNYGISSSIISNIKQLISEYDLNSLISLDTRFVKDDETIKLLQDADLIIYPYTKTGESSSAAVRMGLISRRPVAVTQLEIFDDVRDVVHVLEGASVSQLADSVSSLLNRIAASEPSIADVQDRVSRSLNVNNSTTTMALVDHKMRFAAISEWWEIAMRPDLCDLPLINGRFEDGCIKSDRSGIICYGPYRDISAGLYRLDVLGQLNENEVDPTLFVRITASNGAAIVAEFQIDKLDLKEPFSRVFFLSSQQSGCEVIFISSGSRRVSISGYEMLKRYPH